MIKKIKNFHNKTQQTLLYLASLGLILFSIYLFPNSAFAWFPKTAECTDTTCTTGTSVYQFVNTDGLTVLALQSNTVSATKASHINGIRTAIKTKRASLGMCPYNWTDPNISAGMRIRAVHIQEARTAIMEIYNAPWTSTYDCSANASPGLVCPFQDKTITPNVTPVRATHILDLRDTLVNVKRCGDGICTGPTETLLNCPIDCSSIGATCSDTIRNQGEMGIDCGGPCADPTINPPGAECTFACPTPPPACNDGIMNGTETGIDCGGSCPDCPTCFDVIQNQGETGVDCGGPCPACLPTAVCNNGICEFNENGSSCPQDCCDANTPCNQTRQNLGLEYCRQHFVPGSYSWDTAAYWKSVCDLTTEECTNSIACNGTTYVCNNSTLPTMDTAFVAAGTPTCNDGYCSLQCSETNVNCPGDCP